MLRHDVQDIGDVMEYTREQMLTIVNFLDHIGSASFMSGFKDGMLDCRNWLTGEPTALDPDNGLIDIECYILNFPSCTTQFPPCLPSHNRSLYNIL